MKIDWENVDNIGAVYSKNGEQVNAINTIYVEYKDGRLGKFTYPEGVPLDELKNIKELADSQKLTLKMFDSNSERDTKEIELYEYDLKVQEFMDETEALVIDNRGEKGIAYIKKHDGSIEKRPYSPIMDKFIYESLEAKKQGKFGKFFEIDEGPEAEKRVEALEEAIAKNNNIENEDIHESQKTSDDFDDIYSGRDDLDDAYNTFKDNEENTNIDVDTNNPDDKDTEEVKKDEDSKDIEEKLLEKNYNKKKAAKIAIGVTAGVLGAAGIAAIANSCDRNTGKETDFTNKSFESLMNSMKKDDKRRVFAENVFSVTEALNSKALDKNVFALEEDGEATLHFTYDEVAAAKLVLNNYTSEEMYEIFGTDEIDTNDIMAKYQSFTTKMSLYAMNGKAPSAVASLIENEANRTWFEKIENAIVEFNKAPNSTNADKVIRTFAYFYNHGINGSDGIENDEATLACVKNLAFNMIRGYRDANGEKDYQQYLVVSTEPGSFDDQYRTNKESQVQKGEKLDDHIKIAESGPCTIQNVRRHIESLVERLSTGRIENKDKKEKSSRPSYTEIRKAAARTIDSNAEIKDDILYMNRIRGLEKIDSKNENGYTITKDMWNKMTSEEKRDFAKKHGTVTESKKTTTEKIDESKLTDKEKEEADKQKTYEVNGHRFNSVETAEAYKQGYLAAHNYANEEGSYKHSAIYNAIDVDNPYVVIEEDAGTLNDVVKNRYAYEKRETLLSDSQIQRRLEKDVNNYKNSGSNVNDNMVNAYKLGWTESMNTALEADMKNGELERKKAERLYKEAQEEAKRENEKTPTEDENEKPGNDYSEEDIPTYDENDDPYLQGPNPDIVDPDSLSKSYNAMNEAELDIYNSFETENTENNDTYEADPEIEVSEEDLDSYINNNEVKVLSLKR